MNTSVENIMNADRAWSQTSAASEGRVGLWIRLYLDAISTASKLGMSTIVLHAPDPTSRPEVDAELRRLGYRTQAQESGTLVIVSWLKTR